MGVPVREKQQVVAAPLHSVLVVEDDRAVRRMLGFALGAAGFEVREALASEPVDAVLLVASSVMLAAEAHKWWRRPRFLRQEAGTV
ncbi:MAG: response regulator [Dehalococcoidia bacterium]|nr:response regulator [Dehalococcoidia bacterium]